MKLRVGIVLVLASAVLGAGCTKSGGTMMLVSVIESADGGRDAARDVQPVDAADGGGYGLCCQVPRVLTGLEMYDPNYSTPYHNVTVNGTPRQQAYATCDQLSTWPEPMRPGNNPTQAQIAQYMAEFMAEPDIAVVMPCWDPAKSNSSYGRWQCGGDAGQAAGCMNDGWSCGEGSTCWFDPGGTNSYGCTGTVVKCQYPWN
jgi:hypothetical protein